jgi:hypothetical protein
MCKPSFPVADGAECLRRVKNGRFFGSYKRSKPTGSDANN